MSDYAVSVLVPVYNAARYMETCATSLFSQTLPKIEYVFVDDGSPDNSMEILNAVIQQFPHRQQAIKIIRRAENRGISAARQAAFDAATGEYFLAMDSDDYIEPNMIELLWLEAKRNNADVVFCDYVSEKGAKSVVRKFPFHDSNERLVEAAIRGDSAFWNKLIKRSILVDNNIRTLEGIDHGDDLAVLVKILAYAQDFSYLPLPLYHYIESNAQSVTKAFKPKHIQDRLKLVDEVVSFLEQFGAQYSRQIVLMKALRKAKILLLTNADQHYINLYPEINPLLPALKVSNYTKLILLLAATRSALLLKIWLKMLRLIGK